MAFPIHRPRRLRRTAALRDLVRETDLTPRQLVAPLFVKEGIDDPAPIASMPGQAQHTLESLRKEAREIFERGVRAFVLFGVPLRKDAEGSEAWNDQGIVQRGIGALREELGDDAVVERYRWIAGSHARAGADLVAPSGMMDGQVAAIRSALDGDGRSDVGILAYAAKFASAFYGPFRDAAECTPRFGDRAGYQLDPGNGDEALREIRADLDQGADIVMVKPALPYLDVIRRARDEAGAPVAAFNVSGEYAMVKAAAERGWIEERQAVLEVLTAIRRAGADLILTYHAGDAAGWLS